MINALAVKDKDLIVAKWYVQPQEPNKDIGTIIRVKIVRDIAQTVKQPIQNLRVVRDETTVETRYNYNFRVSDKIVFGGETWLVMNISREYRQGKQKSLALARVNLAEKYTIMQLARVSEK